MDDWDWNCPAEQADTRAKKVIVNKVRVCQTHQHDAQCGIHERCVQAVQ